MEPGTEGATLVACSLVFGVGHQFVKRVETAMAMDGRMAWGVDLLLQHCMVRISAVFFLCWYKIKVTGDLCILLDWLASTSGSLLGLEATMCGGGIQR